jgi:hypothetical protein
MNFSVLQIGCKGDSHDLADFVAASVAGTQGRNSDVAEATAAPFEKADSSSPRLETLEDRLVPSTLTVLNGLDEGCAMSRNDSQFEGVTG